MIKIQRGGRVICPDNQLRANSRLFQGPPRFQHRQRAFEPGKIMISRSVCQMHFAAVPSRRCCAGNGPLQGTGREFPAVLPLLPCLA